MKPDWKHAPKWAQWLAMDEDGRWTWFESEPEISGNEWLPSVGGYRWQSVEEWHLTLEPRP